MKQDVTITKRIATAAVKRSNTARKINDQQNARIDGLAAGAAAQGAPGQGPAGPQGVAGPAGPAGPLGAQGAPGVLVSDTETVVDDVLFAVFAGSNSETASAQCSEGRIMLEALPTTDARGFDPSAVTFVERPIAEGYEIEATISIPSSMGATFAEARVEVRCGRIVPTT